MKRQTPAPTATQAYLLRPFRVAAALAFIALVVSLVALAVTAGSSVIRLRPLDRHLAHLQALQQASVDIQEILVRNFQDKSAPDHAAIDAAAIRLRDVLKRDGSLHSATPSHLREALGFLDSDSSDIQANLLAALSIVRQTLRDENAVQSTILATTRRSAETEALFAAAAMVIAPLAALLVIGVWKRRSFASIGRLSTLLDNVGNLEFQAVAPPAGVNDPLAEVFDRYNDMAARLTAAQRLTEQHAQMLRDQVRAASETLLSQQAEIERGARLAALGEFAAQLAHELRNPISGVSMALRNVEDEIDDPERRDRIAVIAAEMDRVTRLLNALLEKGRAAPETPTAIDTRKLVDDVASLFSYQLPGSIAVRAEVSSGLCVLPCDTVRQVLINLLRNSREAIADKAGEILIDMRRAGDLVTIKVSDDGPGYPDVMLSRGVRPFQTHKTTGVGLGMSVVQRLVHAAGGEVSLSRGVNGGAVTIVTLPCGT